MCVWEACLNRNQFQVTPFWIETSRKLSTQVLWTEKQNISEICLKYPLKWGFSSKKNLGILLRKCDSIASSSIQTTGIIKIPQNVFIFYFRIISKCHANEHRQKSQTWIYRLFQSWIENGQRIHFPLVPFEIRIQIIIFFFVFVCSSWWWNENKIEPHTKKEKWNKKYHRKTSNELFIFILVFLCLLYWLTHLND